MLWWWFWTDRIDNSYMLYMFYHPNCCGKASTLIIEWFSLDILNILLHAKILQVAVSAFNRHVDLDVSNHPLLNLLYYLVCKAYYCSFGLPNRQELIKLGIWHIAFMDKNKRHVFMHIQCC